MNLSDVKFNCKFFRGAIPCKPNKQHDVQCDNCTYFEPWEKHILIIKLGAMGDVIRTTPLVVKYKKMFRNVRFTWLTDFPDVLPPSEIHDIWKPTAFNIEKLKNRKFDIAINLDKEEEACILLAQVNAAEKFGFIWENGHLAAATKAAEHKIITGLFDHISKRNTKSYLEEIFEICHLTFDFEEYLLNYNKALAKKWQEIFESRADGKKVIGLNTGCGNRWLTRLWPDESWVALINGMDKERFFPVLLGGPQEDEKNSNLAKQTGAWYPGTFSLEEFISLTANLNGVVTQVSMMMHIAVGHRTPMVLMNNIFNKHEFELYKRGIILEPESGCDCFYGNSCSRERSCMHDLKPESVLDALNQLV